MKARVSSKTTSIVLSWDEASIPNQICVEGAGENSDWLIYDVREGETSYTLELNQGDRDFYYVEFKYGTGKSGPEKPSYDFDRLQPELDQTYLAFGDINDDGDTDGDDLKYGVMRTLYEGLRVNEGRYQGEGAVLGLIEDLNKDEPTNLNLNMEKLLDFVTGVSLNKTAETITTDGGTVQLIATVAPANASNQNVTWSTSDASVATVDATGKVTAMVEMTAIIQMHRTTSLVLIITR